MPDMTTKSIRVWRFTDAPDYLKELSNHGGDEDWIALVPFEMKDDYIEWLEPGSAFGCCDISRHEFADAIVVIGAHA